MDVTLGKDFLGDEDEADLVEWLVADGATVAQGDSIAQVETSKLVNDFVAPGAGVITFKVAVGDVVSVDDVIATIE
ncbi:lipoyl domain-containing protein [Salinibacterium sp. NG22]|uniref:lipoyl domain-containing protein n=1 Tax=Salinibacterium sp. NG22 TaxID=2792040 RepID=UPI0018CF08B1|nr:lipoyl domain-containing protein [Salinibacterium sp. NG22]MBH0110906.1 lipoyl domain-containing protein [Salinibacterium sp. NG22]